MTDAAPITLTDAAPGVGRITLDHRATRNALDWTMLEAFERVLDEAEGAPALRVAIVGSALDRVFVAGGDIAVMRDLTLAEGTRFVYAGQRLMRRLEESRLAVIAEVGGFALGGGFELALACDMIVASQEAVFGLPEATIGLLPGWGGTQRIVRAVSPQRARELVYTGRRLDASEALQFGFVNAVTAPDALQSETLALAERVLASSPTAVTHSKRALTQGARVSLDQGLVIEAETWLANLSSPNRVEGLTAFLEKRPPRFVTE